MLWAAALVAIVAGICTSARSQQALADSVGTIRTVSTSGVIDRKNRFFQPLGKQFPITCEHCHFESDAWGISAEHVRQLFASTGGRHPIFTAPSANDFHAALTLRADAPVKNRQAAYSLLLNKGLALVRRNFDSAAADFEIVAVIDPSLPQSLHTMSVDDAGEVVADATAGSTRAIPGTAYLEYTARDNGGTAQVWLHRRPLPTTNFRFLTTVSWDGQDTRQSPNPKVRSVLDGVLDVTKGAIRGRQTGPSLTAENGRKYTDDELTTAAEEVTAFMFSTTTAQDSVAGVALNSDGATGGADNLARQPFYFGINDVLQGDLTISPAGDISLRNVPFNPIAFTMFEAWHGRRDEVRAAIERGEALFNAQRLTIADVGGLNGAAIVLPDGSTTTGPAGAIRGSCSNCHDAPNAGDHSTRLPIDIGVSDKAPKRLGRDHVAGLPLFVLRRKSDGAIAQTTDPGRAVISGRFAHIGQFKGPILHGMAARPPFFHNGMAATLEEVVDFYNERFKAGFTPDEKADLVAFLKAL